MSVIAKVLAVRLDAPVTLAEPDWVIIPPAVTVRFVAVIVPKSTAFESTMVMSDPLASTVPNRLVLLDRLTLPAETMLAVSLMVRLVPSA